jgi:hypothetical protein
MSTSFRFLDKCRGRKSVWGLMSTHLRSTLLNVSEFSLALEGPQDEMLILEELDEEEWAAVCEEIEWCRLCDCWSDECRMRQYCKGRYPRSRRKIRVS